MHLLLVIHVYVYGLPVIVSEKSDRFLEYASLVHLSVLSWSWTHTAIKWIWSLSVYRCCLWRKTITLLSGEVFTVLFRHFCSLFIRAMQLFELYNVIAVISNILYLFVLLKLSRVIGFWNFLLVNIPGMTFSLYSMTCFIWSKGIHSVSVGSMTEGFSWFVAVSWDTWIVPWSKSCWCPSSLLHLIVCSFCCISCYITYEFITVFI
jgi:hypothetical protein